MKEIKVTDETVKHVASLARLEVADKEVAVYQNHMQKFLNHVEDLGKLSTDNIKPFFSPAVENFALYRSEGVLREDKIKEPLTVNELLKNAPKKSSNQFRVDAVIEDA